MTDSGTSRLIKCSRLRSVDRNTPGTRGSTETNLNVCSTNKGRSQTQSVWS